MTTTTALTGATTTAANATATTQSKVGADFNMFLKLLVTQMQNQDPLKPMDSTEYTQQLAQYSQVEQTVKQTGALNDILSQLSTQSLTQANALIGREVEIDGSVAGLAGSSPAQWGYQADRAVATIEMTVKDAKGVTMSTNTVDATGTAGRLNWNGATKSGGTAKDGAYTLSAVGRDAFGVEVPLTLTSVGTVGSVEAKGGAVTVGVNGVQVPMTKLVRVAQTAG
jgi:flagellar basal-body rod modification protein FlgD